MKLATKKLHYQCDPIWPRMDQGHLKAEDFTACQKCYSHSVHDKGGNTLNLLPHLTS